ncbi:NAD(P)-dependent oxidoreductase [Occultella glacieicola]|uniref:NAD(P)-dependent oxidoreductase n=1 Tax=Occultella glacieicola TaxID=2518684 RepID=A0ABY2DYI9_9MICO|nr:NAD(P)-dependent oxidoreductase [Occultella glacieicola]TDE89555.1 NAD(P)-dependent oxidoreductase [Occultella glacieicola]
MSARYALVGLGNVGSDLTSAAVAAGLDLHVYDLDAAARERAGNAGAVVHESAAEAVDGAATLVLSLPNAEVVDAVLAGGALDALRPGGALIDMSTNLPQNAVTLAATGRERGLTVLDAPVSYGPDGLVAFVGGPPEDVTAQREWLDAVVTQWTHVGAHGQGQYAKLVQNILSGVQMGVIAEVLGFASRAGTDLDALAAALRPTGAHSRMLERTMPAMRERRYGSAGTMALHAKDMGYALRAAEQIDARMPFTQALLTVFQETLAAGDPRWGQTALIEWFLAQDRDATDGDDE